MAMRPKKITECTNIDGPLVWRLPNSTSRPFAGIWNRSPGDSSTNRITATNTGPQSAMIDDTLSFFWFLACLRERELRLELKFGGKKRGSGRCGGEEAQAHLTCSPQLLLPSCHFQRTFCFLRSFQSYYCHHSFHDFSNIAGWFEGIQGWHSQLYVTGRAFLNPKYYCINGNKI